MRSACHVSPAPLQHVLHDAVAMLLAPTRQTRMWNQLLLSGRNVSGFGLGTATVYQVICICVKH